MYRLSKVEHESFLNSTVTRTCKKANNSITKRINIDDNNILTLS